MFQRWMFVWLVLFCAAALAWPRFALLFGSGFPDPFLAAGPKWNFRLIALVMFCIGCLISADELGGVIKRWPSVLGGTAVQYTAMPALAWLAAELLPLPEDYRLGVMMAGCVPGAMASNVVTLTARGNVSYSVSLTTASTLLSPLIVPLALGLTVGSRHRIDFVSTAMQLLLQVAAPVVLGHGLCRFFPRLERLMRAVAPILANAVILWIIAVVVAGNRGLILRLGQAEAAAPAAWLLLALLLLNLLGYLAGWMAGGAMRLDEAMRRALTIEIGMQNAGLGTVMVGELFPGRTAAQLPTALYTFGCMFTGALLAWRWARTAPPDTLPAAAARPAEPAA